MQTFGPAQLVGSMGAAVKAPPDRRGTTRLTSCSAANRRSAAWPRPASSRPETQAARVAGRSAAAAARAGATGGPRGRGGWRRRRPGPRRPGGDRRPSVAPRPPPPPPAGRRGGRRRPPPRRCVDDHDHPARPSQHDGALGRPLQAGVEAGLLLLGHERLPFGLAGAGTLVLPSVLSRPGGDTYTRWALGSGSGHPLPKASSSIGRVPVSKTGGWGFESLLACHTPLDQRLGVRSQPSR